MDDMAKTFVRRFVERACSAVGCPYIWGGKGDKLWTPVRLEDIAVKLGPNPYGPELGFDCIGLITWACERAGGPDLRATFSAQTLHDWLSELPGTLPGSYPLLRFYGRDHKNITHVSLGLNHIGTDCIVLEAAGAGSDAISWERAKSAGARVRVGWDLRKVDTLQFTAPLEHILLVTP